MTDYIIQSYRVRYQKLVEWRDRYVPVVYPEKVVTNLFYDLYSIALLWSDETLNRNVSGHGNLFKEYLDAENYIISVYRKYQIQVNPNLNELLKLNPIILDCDWRKFKLAIENAKNGSNKDVEEIEFTYIYIGVTIQLILIWLTLCVMGLEREKAFKIIAGTETSKIPGYLLEDMYKSFYQCLGYYLGGQHIGLYQKLPNLW